ncbi:hypothetical protein [Paraburkholderia sp. Ac-20342]|nr:hypothetical protein [Paraburkholderia sp. Ac-20342]
MTTIAFSSLPGPLSAVVLAAGRVGLADAPFRAESPEIAVSLSVVDAHAA